MGKSDFIVIDKKRPNGVLACVSFVIRARSGDGLYKVIKMKSYFLRAECMFVQVFLS